MATHVFVVSWNPTGHERQLVAVEPLQVVHEGSHDWQMVPLKN